MKVAVNGFKRERGWYPKGERLWVSLAHRKTATRVAGLPTTGMVVPMVLEDRSTETGSKPLSLRSSCLNASQVKSSL